MTGSVIFLTITELPDSDAATSLALNCLLANRRLTASATAPESMMAPSTMLSGGSGSTRDGRDLVALARRLQLDRLDGARADVQTDEAFIATEQHDGQLSCTAGPLGANPIPPRLPRSMRFPRWDDFRSDASTRTARPDDRINSDENCRDPSRDRPRQNLAGRPSSHLSAAYRSTTETVFRATWYGLRRARRHGRRRIARPGTWR